MPKTFFTLEGTSFIVVSIRPIILKVDFFVNSAIFKCVYMVKFGRSSAGTGRSAAPSTGRSAAPAA